MSPPVWVAWIEIVVAYVNRGAAWSPPVWVAWIEMMYSGANYDEWLSRHPCGWRGLK